MIDNYTTVRTKTIGAWKKPVLIISIILAAFVGLFMIWGVSVNNSAIRAEEQIQESKSSIDIQVNRRNESLVMMIQVVESYNNHELAALKEVTDARAAMRSGDIETATTNLSIVLEAYPELKSAENYNTLMLEISQSENLIARHQEAYNQEVKSYKKKLRTWPNSMFLNIWSYEAISVDYLDLSGHNNLNFNMNNLFGN